MHLFFQLIARSPKYNTISIPPPPPANRRCCEGGFGGSLGSLAHGVLEFDHIWPFVVGRGGHSCVVKLDDGARIIEYYCAKCENFKVVYSFIVSYCVCV
mgnify:CR=1 FL=1